MKVSKLEIRKFLYFILFGLVTTILVTVCSYSIKEHVDFMQTWQYNATYDFETKIETNKDGKDEFVMYVETPEQLAGAMSVVSNKSVKNNYVKQLKKKNVELFNKVVYSDITDITTTVNGVVKLTKNIDLGGYSWSSINYGGDLDGQGHVIKNVKTALVSGVNSGHTLKNFVISNANITGSNSYVGIVARINSGTIRNVSVVGSSYVNGSNNSNVGGLVGDNRGSIYDCINYSTVHDGVYLGGIAGNNSGTISHCFNKNTIYEYGDTGVRVGGIVGNNTGTIEYCENIGSVYASTNYADGKESFAGGVVGYSSHSISYCGNKGRVECGNNAIDNSYSGGIAGKMSSGSIEYCYNKGYICGNAEDKDIKVSDVSRISYRQIYYRRIIPRKWWHYMESFGTPYWNESGRRCFKGGIAGWSDGSEIGYCYNTGSVEEEEPIKYKISFNVRHVTRYDKYTFKWVDELRYTWWGTPYWIKVPKYDWYTQDTTERLKIYNYISFHHHYNHSPICPTPKPDWMNFSPGCYHTNQNTQIKYTLKFDSTLNIYGNDTYSETFKSWKKGFHEVQVRAFVKMCYNINASDIRYVKLYTSLDGSESNYRTFSTGLTSSTYYVPNCDNYYDSSLPSFSPWVTNSNINDGDPYPKGMYWPDEE